MSQYIDSAPSSYTRLLYPKSIVFSGYLLFLHHPSFKLDVHVASAHSENDSSLF